MAGIAAAAVTVGLSLGISASLLTGISLAASIGASLLSPRPKAPDPSRENIDRLRASIDPRTPRKSAVGITALGTDIRDEEFTDDQKYLHRFIVCASHAVESIDEIWFDDKIAWSLASGVQGEFQGYLEVTPILEGSAANSINISPRMGSTRRYTGLAYVHLRYKLREDDSDDENESPFASQVTTRITIRGKGARLYDARQDSTVPGGSGLQRADEQATWAWNDNACRNPALALLWFLLGYRINGLLAVGKGIPPNRIDLESFIVAANLCDEAVPSIGGGTEPRYRCDGMWSEGDNPERVIDTLKSCMNADLDDVDGKLRLTVFHDDLAVPQASFTDDDVLGAFEWDPGASLENSFNIVRGVFTDPSDESLYQPIDYPEVAYDSPDGIDRIDTYNLPMVQSAGQAQRLAELRYQRQRFGGTFRADFQATAWAAQKNDIVTLTFARRGWVDKLFRVAENDLREDGVVPLVLREENGAIYATPALQAPVDPVATTPFDYTLTGDYRRTTSLISQLIVNSSVTDADPADGLLQADDSGAQTTLSIEDHSRVYTDKTVSVTGATLTVDENGDSLEVSPSGGAKKYHIAYDDPKRVGGPVTYTAYNLPADAQTSGTNPSRHYVSTITMPEEGGTAEAGGATPPGWDAGDYR